MIQEYELLKDYLASYGRVFPVGTILISNDNKGKYYRLENAPEYLEGSVIRSLPDWFKPVEEIWKPKMGYTYYFIQDDGYICVNAWNNALIDRNRLEMFNVFKTLNDAFEARERVKQLLKNYHKN